MKTSPSPLVSIITCFLNEEQFLEETIQSVLAQEYPYWELLLIDDGSTDSSTRLAKTYAERFPGKIFYHEHPHHGNIGLSASRNVGIARARGELVAFLDADDVWLPQKLSAQVTILQAQPSAAMLCEASEYWYSWADPGKANRIVYIGNSLEDQLVAPPKLMIHLYPLGNTPAPCPSGIMCRRAALLKHGGFEAHFTGANQMYEDQGFLSKMYVNEPVYISRGCHNRYRQRTGSLVQSVTEGGKYHAVRLYYLEWLEKYLQAQQLNLPQVKQLLQKALRPYRQPLLHFLSTLPHKGLGLFTRS